MPLIPKVPFVSGAVFTPEVATEMTGITFDNQTTYYGHFNKIADADLSDAPGEIKARVGALSTNLKVSSGTGLNANYTAGLLLYGTTLYTIGASSVALTASTINYIYGSISGAIVATSAQPPIVRALLATVTTNTTGVISVTDYREGVSVEVVKPFTLSVRNFGGRGDQGDFLAVGGENLADGEYYYNNFTVGVGKTITISKLAYIYCSGNVNIGGTINVTPASQGGGGVIPRTSICIPGQGLGAGINELLPNSYSFRASPIGSGGSSGFTQGTASSGHLDVNNTTNGGAGGAGGGGVIFEAAGSIIVSGTISANGVAGAIAKAFDNGISDKYALGGGGGGSGGSITLKSLGSLVVSGTLSVVGGAGGAGALGNANVTGESGSGGGGGIITIQSPAINTTGSVLIAAGGAAGTPSGAGAIPLKGFGGIGGSYGGVSGQIIGDGGAGTTGIIRTQSFSPIG